MKKYLLYTFIGATALFNAACDEDFNEDVVPPQAWEQEEAIILPGLTAAGVEEINLGEVESDSVVAFNPSFDATKLPEGALLSNFRVELTPKDVEGVEAVTLPADNSGMVEVKAFQELIEKDFGKRPELRKYNAVVYADVVANGQAMLLKSETMISATPKAPFISTGYYLIGNMCEWDAAKMLKFTHSNKDVYEDPIFTLIFSTAGDNNYWKIIPQENAEDGDVWNGPQGVVGVSVDGDPSLKGSLICGEGVQAGKIEKGGMYQMTLNMMDYTFEIKEIAPEYYLVGALQGWNANEDGKVCMLYPTDVMHHSYTTKFENDANLKLWLGSEFGNWDKATGTEKDGDQSAEGTLGGGGAIKCPEPNAFYTFSVDLSTNTYKWTKLENQAPAAFEKIGLIGDFNGWGDDALMTSKAPHNWYIQNFQVENDGALKFRANQDWGTNWGAKQNLSDQHYGVATNNGDNISIKAGTYNVFFNDITGEFVFKKI